MAITLRDDRGRVAPGGGGRTPGSRNKRPGLVDHLPPEAFANIATKLYQQALAGDVAAAKVLVDRYDPVPRHGRVSLPLPAGQGLEGPQAAVALAAEALAAATRGEVGLDEALAVIDGLRRLAELRDTLTNEERREELDRKFAILHWRNGGHSDQAMSRGKGGFESLRVAFPAACGVTCSRERARRPVRRPARKAHPLLSEYPAPWGGDPLLDGSPLRQLRSKPGKLSREGLAAPVEDLDARKVVQVGPCAVQRSAPGRAGPIEAGLPGGRLRAIVEVAVGVSEAVDATTRQAFAGQLAARHLERLFLGGKRRKHRMADRVPAKLD